MRFYTSFDIRAKLAGSELVAFRDGHEGVIAAAIATTQSWGEGLPNRLGDPIGLHHRLDRSRGGNSYRQSQAHRAAVVQAPDFKAGAR
jgi:hypothetical protein